ncbi:hypothetical protein NUU61_009054 [Penicillium alfredii]|uniref:Uncharacterized protein n=1 Tax=Penicillium alfredii TaxID=1506179 RepID=A0A9W9EMI0_9EURO|nr:uncharacterized protein NUU61_009054 [Penicillium alfredii]KAJ5084475.1 hypothetical protein NUU61_009054 [Penicillium alfredii]
MGSPDLDQDISPIPRSREENQERAFIAASRRKDRSLDARLESANRASMLHKKRTGKAFHITKEIVEKEAMYEEVDERYQEKRIRMLQAQNMQIEEQFHRHLLAAFAARAHGSHSTGSSIASRRASMTPRSSVDGGSRKMTIDLSNIRSSFPPAMGSMESASMASPSTVAPSDGYVLSPTTTYDPNAQSYMTAMDGAYEQPAPLISATTAATPSTQVPAYVAQPTPAWSTPSWVTYQQPQQPQQVPTPGQTPTDAHAVHLWQQQMMQQAQMPADTATTMHMRQFRDRLASAPELPLQPSAVSASVSGPSRSQGHRASHGHSRGQSQPTNPFHNNLQLLTQGTHLAQMPHASRPASPKVEALSAGTKSTPDFCPTPNTPLSPTTAAHAMPVAAPVSKEEGDDGVMVSHEDLDPDFNEFSQFALGLGNTSFGDRETFGFDELVTLEDFTTVSC